MPELSIQIQHRLGSFSLDLALTIDHWPAVLFGPSGSGKSTVLRILAGLVVPDQARIVFDAQVLVDTALGMRQRPGTNGVQLVTQRAALFPHLTVRENIAFGLASAARRGPSVSELMRLLHIERRGDRMPTQLSGGERQRVALARALAPQPRLLLLDEAFVGLDGDLRQEILADLQQVLAISGASALHVTHEVSDAYSLNACVIAIKDGGLIAQGDARDVLASERERVLQILQ